MPVEISHRGDHLGRRAVKIDGQKVGTCKMVPNRHSAGSQWLFFLPGQRDYFATFPTSRDLRDQLPAVLAQVAA